MTGSTVKPIESTVLANGEYVNTNKPKTNLLFKDYLQLWKLRAKAWLLKAKLTKISINRPKDYEESIELVISILADNFLVHVRSP
jgi:hypothetical protein